MAKKRIDSNVADKKYVHWNIDAFGQEQVPGNENTKAYCGSYRNQPYGIVLSKVPLKQGTGHHDHTKGNDLRRG